MRAAVLHGPDDLRVEGVDEPAGEVLVRVEAATACGTDVKMLRHGHRVLGPYPSRFGHETAGVRADTGERVLVGDSVACGACPPCRAGRTNLCRAMRMVLGVFAERVAAPGAPRGSRRPRRPCPRSSTTSRSRRRRWRSRWRPASTRSGAARAPVRSWS